MYYPAYPGTACGFKEGQRVLHRLRVGEIAMVEAYPVGVIQCLCALQRAYQFVGTVEVVRMSLYQAAERIAPLSGVCQGAYALAVLDQPSRDVLARVAEGSSDDV